MPLDTLADLTPSQPFHSERALTVNVRMPDGGWLAPPAAAGRRLIDILADFGLSVRADCRDTEAAAGCFAQIPAEWRILLPPPLPDEAALLKSLSDAGATARLLSRIVMSRDLDGLQLELHPDSLVPQTYWIAG